MKLLLDTHALYWWMIEEKRLSSKARKAIGARTSQIFVSPASACELAYKHREGSLPKAGALVRNFDAELAEKGFAHLPISNSSGPPSSITPARIIASTSAHVERLRTAASALEIDAVPAMCAT